MSSTESNTNKTRVKQTVGYMATFVYAVGIFYILAALNFYLKAYYNYAEDNILLLTVCHETALTGFAICCAAAVISQLNRIRQALKAACE